MTTATAPVNKALERRIVFPESADDVAAAVELARPWGFGWPRNHPVR
jgi:hypothetical protein